jgi:predicted acylesterase/phospholipase RssA
MVAALHAAGFRAADIQELGTTLRRRHFLRYNWPELRALRNLFRRRAHRTPAGIWSLAPYHRTLNRLLQRARFQDLRLPCYIQATDLSNLRPVLFSRERDPFMEVAFAVQASSAFPGLMAPVEWGGLTLADGGAFVDLAALPIRAGRIIVSNVSLHGYERQALTSLPRVLGAYLRFRERTLVPPRSVRGIPVTVITYPTSLIGLKPFRRPRPEVARRIIAEACGAALAALSGGTNADA